MLFKTARTLIHGIELFLNSIMKGNSEFSIGIANYLKQNETGFQQNLLLLKELEGKADDIRREFENDLYRHSLIPQHRGDVLALMENLDDIIDLFKEVLFLFDVERPLVPAEFHSDFIELTEKISGSVESIVKSTQLFFIDPSNIKAELTKVYSFEKVADRLALNLKRKIFAYNDFDLSRKTHLRYFTVYIDSIADKSEFVADMLSIYAIKQLV